MAESYSTGLRNAKLTTGSVKSILDGGEIHIFDGTKPVDADATEGTANLLCVITKDALAHVAGQLTNGLTWASPAVGGVLSKTVGETWKGLGTALAGTGKIATWFRFYDKNVTTGASTTAVRYDGNIGSSSAYDLQLSVTAIVEAAPVEIRTATFTEKASA